MINFFLFIFLKKKKVIIIIIKWVEIDMDNGLDPNFFFVCTIALFATDSEKIFINDIDEKIFSTVYEIIRGKIYN
jgi:hypothetical protein